MASLSYFLVSLILFVLPDACSALSHGCLKQVPFTSSASDPNFVAANGVPLPTCTASYDNIIHNNQDILLNVDRASQTCARYTMVPALKYGEYTCRIKTQKVPGVMSTCALVSAVPDGASPFYLRVYGSRTDQITVQFPTRGESLVHDLTFDSSDEYHDYTLVYNPNNVIYVMVEGIIISRLPFISFPPDTTFVFSVSHETYNETEMVEHEVTSSSLALSGMSFVRPNCDQEVTTTTASVRATSVSTYTASSTTGHLPEIGTRVPMTALAISLSVFGVVVVVVVVVAVVMLRKRTGFVVLSRDASDPIRLTNTRENYAY
eukprot:TRINITY_DN2170_c0_g2_i2.p1 TRINITY_DN2170_c0_g2~~TRINITY_DN2170_c0_g2_i2.p1  ORF type:complete len:319 (-),score=40.64 TRINITY_DN2170_c0_g2_i2:40-996(-)